MNDSNTFDLLHIVRLIYKRKKFVLGITAIALVVAILFCLIAPNKYTSSTVFIVKNPILLDKNYVFRNTMYEHKEYFAIPNDVDQVETIFKSQSLISFLIDELNLAEHYGTESPFWLRFKVKNSMAFDRKDTKNIEIFFTDEDPEVAEKATRAIREYLEEKFVNYFKHSNKQVADAVAGELKYLNSDIDSLTQVILNLKAEHNLNGYLLPTRGTALAGSNVGNNLSASQSAALEQINNLTQIKDQLSADQARYISTIHEFELMERGGMKVFYLVQDAYKPDIATHPKSILIIIGTLIGSLVLTSLWVVFAAFYKEKLKSNL